MSFETIVLFFVYTFGLGFTITSFIKKQPENPIERFLMRIGIGLGVFPVLAVFMNLLHIPLDWRIFLVLSVIYPLFYMFKNLKNIKIKGIALSKSNINILIVLVLFIFTLSMYEKGAFSYPYMEDDDPWNHAMGVQYVSVEKTAYVEKEANPLFSYIDAYPPGYEILMAMLHQTSPSLMWTLKFFNSLIISLGIIFFYFFAKEFTHNRNKALFSTFVLAMIPCYLSHFIWAHALVITLIFPLFYCIEQMENDKRWGYAAALIFASIFLVQITQAIKIGVLFIIYFAIKWIASRKFNKQLFFSAAAGVLMSFLFWWLPMILKYGREFFNEGMGLGKEGLSAVTNTIVTEKNYIGFLGSATRPYTFNDFFIAKTQNMINVPVGVGLVLCILLAISVVYIIARYRTLLNEKNSWMLITLIWLVFAFFGIHGGTRWWSPIAFWSFRYWLLFAISAAIIAGEGLWLILSFAREIGKQIKLKKVAVVVVLFLIVFGVWKTSGYQKYAVNTAQWGPGGWLGPDPGSLMCFLWLKQNTPIDTKVFVYTELFEMTSGFDKYSCEWCRDVMDFRKTAANKSADELHEWMEKNQYQYLLIDGKYTADQYGQNETINRINELINSGKFSAVYQGTYQDQKTLSFVFKVV